MRHIKTSRFVMLASAVLFICSCSGRQQGETHSLPRAGDSAGIKTYGFPIDKFSLPYSLPVHADSNSLIYLKQVPFDTSYLLHITRQGSQERGVCYLVLPAEHRDLEDFHDQAHELLFFTGFSFSLDASQWELLKRKTTESMTGMADSSMSNSLCLHCPSYSLYYNNQERGTGNSKLQSNFKTYDTFIRDSLIYPMLAKKVLKLKIKN